MLGAQVYAYSSFFVSGLVARGHQDLDCDYEYYKSGNVKWQQCCYTDYDEDGKQKGPVDCRVDCFKNNGDHVDCKKVLMEGTFNPDITGNAGAGILQDENKNNSKDTNIDNNAGVLQHDNTTNSSNNTLRQSFGKNGNPLVDKNIFRNNGAGVAPYAGDSSTWCKDIGGQKVCTCNGGTDCLHCRDTGMPCTDKSRLPATIK